MVTRRARRSQGRGVDAFTAQAVREPKEGGGDGTPYGGKRRQTRPRWGVDAGRRVGRLAPAQGQGAGMTAINSARALDCSLIAYVRREGQTGGTRVWMVSGLGCG